MPKYCCKYLRFHTDLIILSSFCSFPTSYVQVALQLARETDNPQKWSQLAGVASSKNNFDMMRECLKRANDFSGQLLLATSAGDADLLRELGTNSNASGKHNISFLAMFLLGDLERCLDILIETNRIPEAAFFARTYLPSRINDMVERWRTELAKRNEKAGQSLADPAQYENLFPGYQESLKTEEFLRATEWSGMKWARETPHVPLNINRDAMEECKQAMAAETDGAPYQGGKDRTDAVPTEPSNWSGTPAGLLPTPTPSATETNPVGNSEGSLEKERKNSLDEFDIELDELNLDEDDNIDTSVSLQMGLHY